MLTTHSREEEEKPEVTTPRLPCGRSISTDLGDVDENPEAVQFRVGLSEAPSEGWIQEFDIAYRQTPYTLKPPVQVIGDALEIIYLPRYSNELQGFFQFLGLIVQRANEELHRTRRDAHLQRPGAAQGRVPRGFAPRSACRRSLKHRPRTHRRRGRSCRRGCPPPTTRCRKSPPGRWTRTSRPVLPLRTPATAAADAPGAAGQSLPRAALPDAEVDFPVGKHFDELGVGALGKRRMRLDLRPDGGDGVAKPRRPQR